jgi:hypothetical protein
MFASPDTLPAIAGALLVVQGILWVCMVDGNILLFDTETNEPKRKVRSTRQWHTLPMQSNSFYATACCRHSPPTMEKCSA